MLEGIKDFVKEVNEITKKENMKINELHKEIDNYETLAYIVEQTGSPEQILYCKQKINECYIKIDRCLEKINNSRDRIATMRAIDKIIKRGEKMCLIK